MDFFEQQFQLVAICPEVGAGLGVPRPPVQLVQTALGLRALGRDEASLDVSGHLIAYRQSSCSDLSAQLISGYIFKSRSPSCGLHSTPVFDDKGQLLHLSSGLQADYFQRQMPWLVFREETQLLETNACQHFLWLCKVNSECQQAIERDELPGFQLHYANALPSIAANIDITVDANTYRCRLLKQLDMYYAPTS
jgi:uncharacterized protein YbbK (DUF523 family)